MKRILLLLPFLFLYAPLRADTLKIGAFGGEGLAGWEERSFKGNTLYSLVALDGRRVVHAVSEGAASGMFREMRIDLDKNPWLNWSWRVEKLLPGRDERSRGGDDYPARIYVVFSGGLFFWKTRALNYVWSGSQAPGTTWPNAYTGNAVMLSVETGAKNLGGWMSYRRNIKEDARRYLGEDYRYVDAVAIMTDTDNGGGQASAYYGDIYFTSQEEE